MQLSLALCFIDRKEKRFRQVAAVNGYRVDLVSRIRARHITGRGMSGSSDANANNSELLVKRAPFALHTDDPATKVEQKVVTAMLRHRLQNIDTQLDRLERDRRLSDVALVIGGEHPAILAPIE